MIAQPIGQVIATDMDGDGDADLVVTRSGATSLLTHGAGSTFTVSSVWAEDAGEIEAGDLDGDGRADVATVGGSGLIRVYHNTASGWTRTEHVPIKGYWPLIDGIEVADVTGDGRADVMATNSGNAPSALVNVFRQNADGSLASPVAYPAYNIPSPVEAADIDGDARTDVVTVNNAHSAVSLLRQQADGTLAPNIITRSPLVQHPVMQSLALGDVDGDGRNDIAHGSDGGLAILRHPGGVRPGPQSQEFVRSVSPANFADPVGLGTSPQVVFQVGLDPASVTAQSVRLVDGRTGATVPTTPSYSAATKTVTLTPSSPLHANKPCRILVDGVRDSAGNVQPWRFTSTFHTVDQAPLALSGFSALGKGNGVLVAWEPPPIGDLGEVVVRVAVGGTPPGSPTAGIGGYAGTDNGVLLTGLDSATTYSLAAWVRDKGGALSPVRTATLIGSRVTIEVTSSQTHTSASTPVIFTGTLTRPDTGAALAGQAAPTPGGPGREFVSADPDQRYRPRWGPVPSWQLARRATHCRNE